MAPRDYKSAPAADRLNLGKIIDGLAGDLDALRAGKISVPDAMARAILAKQIMNGVRLYMQGAKMLGDEARDITPLPTPDAGDAPSPALPRSSGQRGGEGAREAEAGEQ